MRIEKIHDTPASTPSTAPRTGPSPAPRADEATSPPQDRADVDPEALEPSPSPGPQARPANLQVGNMNLGGGNAEARSRFDEIKKTVGEQVVGNGIDLATFQEVDVGTRRAGGKDYNQEILSAVFEADLGGRDTQALGDGRYQTTLPDGTRRIATITQEKPADGNGDVTVYTATYQDEAGQDVRYTMVHGRSIDHDGGTFGNSVLLGPGQELPRDENGQIREGAIQVHEIGEDRGSKERRTALEVNTAEGQTVISTHFTAGSEDSKQKARSAEYRSLDEICQGKPEVILGGDLNSAPGESYTVGGLWGWNPFGRDYRYPTAGEMGFEEGTGGGGLDHVLVRGGDAVGHHSVDGVERVHGFDWVDVAG